MPRVSKAETERNRALIETVSARLFREQGLKVSLADVMAAANLTHGGFYGHFKSKDELIAIACANAFAESKQKWQKLADSSNTGHGQQLAIIDSYLAKENIKQLGDGCPLASLATDVAREPEDKEVRAVFHQGLQQLLAIFASDNKPQAEALVDLSTLVGALVLARANSGYAIAEEILSSAHQALVSKAQ